MDSFISHLATLLAAYDLGPQASTPIPQYDSLVTRCHYTYRQFCRCDVEVFELVWRVYPLRLMVSLMQRPFRFLQHGVEQRE